MRFLHGKELAQAITKSLSSTSCNVAVAFIGAGAAERLGIKKRSNARIICDLWSGACNPAAIRELRRAGAVVKRRDGLHAKVYLGERSAVVCSANASVNGFAEGVVAQDFGLEAGVLVDDSSGLMSITQWFEGQFEAAHEVSAADLKKADELWKRRPRRPAMETGLGSGHSVLARAIQTPDAFPDLGFVFTNSSVSTRERSEALADAKLQLPDRAAELTDKLSAFHGWEESDLLKWPMTFVAYHQGGRGKQYVNANRFFASNETRGDVYAKREWSRISGLFLSGSKQVAVLAADRTITKEIMKNLDGGLVFRTASELAAFYEREIGPKGKAFV